MPQGGGEHDFWPLGVEIVPGSKTPYLIDRNLLIDFHKVLYRTLVVDYIYSNGFVRVLDGTRVDGGSWTGRADRACIAGG
jgi:hypothetical protein